MQERKTESIPAGANPVLILEQSAHCDWDWMTTFPDYYANGYYANGSDHQPVRTTLEQAIQYIGEAVLPYTYVFCEVAWLRKFMSDPDVPQATKEALRGYAGSSFLFSSGGITSADNLATHTEAFIRNYLIGRRWLLDTFGVEASLQMWIPDDFGHDAQLPVLLQAMGYTSAAFERVPAQAQAMYATCSWSEPNDTAPSLFLPTDVGLDFVWQARDGSRVQAHFLLNGYCEGNDFGNPPTIDDGAADIEKFIRENLTWMNAQGQQVNVPQSSRYLFVPIDCDFTAPYRNLPEVVAAWNAARWAPGADTSQLDYPTSFVVMGSYDQYAGLVAGATGGSGPQSTLPVLLTTDGGTSSFIPHPYYSGCYGSRPELKNLHYATVRTLLMAESMQLLLEAVADDPDSQLTAKVTLGEVENAWQFVLPSTHHDYVTGTSPDDVYSGEQLDLLTKASNKATHALSMVLNSIGSAIAPLSSSPMVAVFNSQGFARSGIAVLELPPVGTFNSATLHGQRYPVQPTADGKLLVQANVPALGYTTMDLTTAAPSAGESVRVEQRGDTIVMFNNYVYVVLTEQGMQEISGISDSSPNAFQSGQPGNQIVFYEDSGNIYRFAMEMPCYDSNGSFEPSTRWIFQPTSMQITEDGPCRGTVVVTGTVSNSHLIYTITYQLHSTDRALRISVHGAAPASCSVMVRFPFRGTPAQLAYGTTAHWDQRSPRQFTTWKESAHMTLMTFEPAHEFVGVVSDANALTGAIYTFASPAWAIEPSTGAVIGCILRNTPNGGNAAQGSDIEPHTITYAVAPPDGLALPGGNAWGDDALLGHALEMNNPLVAVNVPKSGTHALPAELSLASTTDRRALITAMKRSNADPAQVIVRLTQQTNGPLEQVNVRVADVLAAKLQQNGRLAAQSVSALETPLTQSSVTGTTADAFTAGLPYALSTVALG